MGSISKLPFEMTRPLHVVLREVAKMATLVQLKRKSAVDYMIGKLCYDSMNFCAAMQHMSRQVML